MNDACSWWRPRPLELVELGSAMLDRGFSMGPRPCHPFTRNTELGYVSASCGPGFMRPRPGISEKRRRSDDGHPKHGRHLRWLGGSYSNSMI